MLEIKATEKNLSLNVDIDKTVRGLIRSDPKRIK